MVQTRSATKLTQSAVSTCPVSNGEIETLGTRSGEQSTNNDGKNFALLYCYEIPNGPEFEKNEESSAPMITGPSNTQISKDSRTIRRLNCIEYAPLCRPVGSTVLSQKVLDSFQVYNSVCKENNKSGIKEKCRKNAENVTAYFPTGKKVVDCLKEYTEDAMTKISNISSKRQEWYNSLPEVDKSNFSVDFANSREDYLSRNPPPSADDIKKMRKKFDLKDYCKRMEAEFGDATVAEYDGIEQPNDTCKQVIIPINMSSKCSSSG